MKKALNSNPAHHIAKNDEIDNQEEYPVFPGSEDIYNKFKKEKTLDPGSELDDDQEEVGSEDEENNFYSIGGENHNDLDEDYDELW